MLIITIILVLIIAGLYQLSRKRLLKILLIQQALEKQYRKVDALILDQDQKICGEKNKALNELREKIARDMHDGLSSSLANLKFYIINKEQREQDKKTRALLKDLELEVNSVYIQAREYMHHLNEDLDQVVHNFGNFLLCLSKQFSDPDGFYIDLRVNIEELNKRLNDEQKNEMNLVIKEAVANTLKHAWASKLTLTINFDEKNCNFNIVDNGRGFSIELTEKGLGLESIKARISSLKGIIDVESAENGTYLRGSFPLVA